MKKILAVLAMLTLVLGFLPASVAAEENISLVSGDGTEVMAYGPLDHYAGPESSEWVPGSPAVLAWRHGSWPAIAGSSAQYISTAYFTESPSADTWRKFTKTFTLCEGAYNIQADVKVAANSDNAEEVWFNGEVVGRDGEIEGPFIDNHEWNTITSYSITPVEGTNTLTFIVRNYAQAGGTPQSNPTGLIFDANVSYDCPVEIDIDIKPGSYPNSFNVDGHGVVPVAILGSKTFDVTEIDPISLSFGGMSVRFKGKDRPQCSVEDVTGADMPFGAPDGFLDLVCQFEDRDSFVEAGLGYGEVTGELYDGTRFYGQDEINMVP